MNVINMSEQTANESLFQVICINYIYLISLLLIGTFGEEKS